MIVGVQGTNSFNDYNVFLRAMGVAMSALQTDDRYFYIYSAGPANINAMVSEFSNLSEKGMRARGKKIKFFKVPPSWIEENIESVNYFMYLSKPKESTSKLVNTAQSHNIEVGLFRY